MCKKRKKENSVFPFHICLLHLVYVNRYRSCTKANNHMHIRLLADRQPLEALIPPQKPVTKDNYDVFSPFLSDDAMRELAPEGSSLQWEGAPCPSVSEIQELVDALLEMRAQRDSPRSDGIREVLEGRWIFEIDDVNIRCKGWAHGESSDRSIAQRPPRGSRARRPGDWICECSCVVFTGNPACPGCKWPPPQLSDWPRHGQAASSWWSDEDSPSPRDGGGGGRGPDGGSAGGRGSQASGSSAGGHSGWSWRDDSSKGHPRRGRGGLTNDDSPSPAAALFAPDGASTSKLLRSPRQKAVRASHSSHEAAPWRGAGVRRTSALAAAS